MEFKANEASNRNYGDAKCNKIAVIMEEKIDLCYNILRKQMTLNLNPKK
jgi:hypothetical protein